MGKSTDKSASVARIGLDLAKNVFQAHGVDANGEVILARKVRRAGLLPFAAKLGACEIAMEACSSAHHWARELSALGHSVKLIPPAHVKP
jgi:transposase